jgi:hypothetical protein
LVVSSRTEQKAGANSLPLDDLGASGSGSWLID